MPLSCCIAISDHRSALFCCLPPSLSTKSGSLFKLPDHTSSCVSSQVARVRLYYSYRPDTTPPGRVPFDVAPRARILALNYVVDRLSADQGAANTNACLSRLELPGAILTCQSSFRQTSLPIHIAGQLIDAFEPKQPTTCRRCAKHWRVKTDSDKPD